MKKAPFIALSATFFDDPRIVEVGEKAGWLLLAMACDSRLHRGDGQVDAHRMSRLGVQGWKPRLDRLLAVLAPDVVLVSDGGGKRTAARRLAPNRGAVIRSTAATRNAPFTRAQKADP